MLDNRFWSKVTISTIHFYKDTPCWEWIGYIRPDGYASFFLNGTKKLVHRLSYEYIKGKIPKGLDLDHLCRNHKCCNPDHLDPVTRKENLRRGLSGFLTGLKQSLKTHCPHGHKYNEENTYIRSNRNHRECKICMRIRDKQYRERKKLENTQ